MAIPATPDDGTGQGRRRRSSRYKVRVFKYQDLHRSSIEDLDHVLGLCLCLPWILDLVPPVPLGASADEKSSSVSVTESVT